MAEVYLQKNTFLLVPQLLFFETYLLLEISGGTKTEAAKAVGKLVAERAAEKGIKVVVFDRGGYLYHGRVQALAEAARENGLEF